MSLQPIKFSFRNKKVTTTEVPDSKQKKQFQLNVLQTIWKN